MEMTEICQIAPKSPVSSKNSALTGTLLRGYIRMKIYC